jgi:hypothetical protein
MNPISGRSNSRIGTRTVVGFIATVSIILTLAIMLPLSPSMPTDGLDPSWRYALNEAVAKHLVFGKDLIFTFGPLGSVYTWVYHPGTDHIMLFASAIIALGFCSGCFLLTWDTRPGLLVLLPLLPN